MKLYIPIEIKDFNSLLKGQYEVEDQPKTCSSEQDEYHCLGGSFYANGVVDNKDLFWKINPNTGSRTPISFVDAIEAYAVSQVTTHSPNKELISKGLEADVLGHRSLACVDHVVGHANPSYGLASDEQADVVSRAVRIAKTDPIRNSYFSEYSEAYNACYLGRSQFDRDVVKSVETGRPPLIPSLADTHGSVLSRMEQAWDDIEKIQPLETEPTALDRLSLLYYRTVALRSGVNRSYLFSLIARELKQIDTATLQSPEEKYYANLVALHKADIVLGSPYQKTDWKQAMDAFQTLFAIPTAPAFDKVQSLFVDLDKAYKIHKKAEQKREDGSQNLTPILLSAANSFFQLQEYVQDQSQDARTRMIVQDLIYKAGPVLDYLVSHFFRNKGVSYNFRTREYEYERSLPPQKQPLLEVLKTVGMIADGPPYRNMM